MSSIDTRPPREGSRRARGLPYRDDIEEIGVSRLRALGVIAPADKTVRIAFPGGEALVVGVWHRVFPNGGSWSFFLCPTCGRRVRTLRLLGARVVCWECDGLKWRCQAHDKGPRIERLKRLLNGPPARLEPGKGGNPGTRGKARLRQALRRAMIVQRRHRLGLEKQ